MKEKVNQLFKDKLVLVMLVLGLLTIVAAAGVITLQRGRTEESPYLNLEGDMERLVDQDGEEPGAGGSNAAKQDEGWSQDNVLASGDTEDKAGRNEEPAPSAKITAKDETKKPEIKTAPQNAAQETEAAAAGAGPEAAASLVLNFAQIQSMSWPVEGNVLLDYSMDSTIYFPTLEQYKCNPGLVIQGDVSQPVSVPANARVTEVGANEEIGNYLVLDLGDEYSLTCGQLKEVQAVEGEYLEKGQVLGYVAEPTKYYTVEGPNVFLELKKDGKAVDPLDYLE